MRDIFLGATRASLVTLVLCGLMYPLVLVGLGQTFLPFQANGSLLRDAQGTVIGSHLIGQDWTGPEWFHGRPSATTAANDAKRAVPYNAAASGGSNLGPGSKQLAARLAGDRVALEHAQPELADAMLPADLLTTSSSGLDPDISPANAALQVERVARARGVPAVQISALVRQHTTGRTLGVFGEPRVNVLALNLALQQAFPRR
ncbi:MAG: potassium-transporting ATPase subunit KdpC [Alphaproteobacteria bacterium]|nr:potassium-transporting ATPase subunit KdpC [Alphaproteobacteria bacterium]